MSRRYQRYALADEGRDDADDELIDRHFIEKGGDELAATHHPNILSGFSAHLFRECTNRLRYETDADGDRWRGRLTREHVVHVICAEVRAHLDTQVESLSTENLRVDRAHEFWQAVKTFRRRPIRQPVDVAVRSSDVTISTRRDVNDDFSLRHRGPLQVLSRPLRMNGQSMPVLYCGHGDGQAQTRATTDDVGHDDGLAGGRKLREDHDLYHGLLVRTFRRLLFPRLDTEIVLTSACDAQRMRAP